jgi:ribosome-binding protein aMBF1 (putative translation factor)
MSGYICFMPRSSPRDDLDEYVSSRDAREPGFRAKVDAAEARRSLGQKLKKVRGKRSQSDVAASMGTTESIVRRIEHGDDVRISTLEKYARALGKELHVSLR